ncbi:MAG: GNAT family N-acetyltransferase [Treponema sp.]|jgi:phosphinothricin acetyltransferase|nr:GNAT family N-acetyltransferase [Treponema sp.]
MVSALIRQVTPNDAGPVTGIYNYYVQNTVITFEEEPVETAEMERRIRTVGAAYPWFVLEEPGAVLGYAYANKFKERSAYRYSAEISIYLQNGLEGSGLGTRLMQRLLDEMKMSGVHALIGGITLPNERSVALHEKFGFEKTAHFREVGFKMNRWLDVGYWELILK